MDDDIFYSENDFSQKELELKISANENEIKTSKHSKVIFFLFIYIYKIKIAYSEGYLAGSEYVDEEKYKEANNFGINYSKNYGRLIGELEYEYIIYNI